jgi:hypothetical protein
MAAYYDNRKEYGAAKYCYGEVIKKYPDTELAKQSRERVTQIASEPDRPAKMLASVVNMLPENRERTRVARIPELQKGSTFLARQQSGGSDPATATTPPANTVK